MCMICWLIQSIPCIYTCTHTHTVSVFNFSSLESLGPFPVRRRSFLRLGELLKIRAHLQILLSEGVPAKMIATMACKAIVQYMSNQVGVSVKHEWPWCNMISKSNGQLRCTSKISRVNIIEILRNLEMS